VTVPDPLRRATVNAPNKVRAMRAVVITKHGGPDVLRVEERPDPPIGPGEVRIEVAASGINFADVMARMGLYPDAPKPPMVMGYEVAGTVVELGEGVTEVAHGDRVLGGTMFGGHASEVVVATKDTTPLPDSLTFEQGAAIPVNYSTAWAGLIGYGNLQAGERVLIHAAAGGVGISATQIAKRHGAVVHGTSSPGKHDALLEMGVDHPIDYTQPKWYRDQPKFDVIMDAIGGDSFCKSYDLLRAGGRLVCFGASSLVSGEKRSVVRAVKTITRMPKFNLIKQMSQSKTVIGLNMLSLWKDRGTLEPWMTPLRALMEDGTVNPVVAGAFAFEDAAEAHRMITERRNVGKVVLVP
jgi:NADPH:quinone reductase-like Zn-dependent oxidoreductase